MNPKLEKMPKKRLDHEDWGVIVASRWQLGKDRDPDPFLFLHFILHCCPALLCCSI
jgi:hypothetical protein